MRLRMVVENKQIKHRTVMKRKEIEQRN